MTKTLALLIAAGTLLATVPAFARVAPAAPQATATTTVDADPALWVVKDPDTTIYLFGTIHLLKPGLSWFDEAVKRAFDNADTLVLEINEPDPDALRPLMMKLGFDAAGQPLSTTLPGDKGQLYLAAMADLGMPAAVSEHFKPWLAAMTLSMAPLQQLGYSAADAPEQVLTKAATRSGKTLDALETAQQQLGYLAALSPAAQHEFLVSTLDDLPAVGDTMATMVADWAKGDPDALAATLNDELTGSPELEKTLLTDRNARWAGWIINRLKTPGTVFVAVGAGHLAGSGSVIADLRAKQVTVTRIRY